METVILRTNPFTIICNVQIKICTYTAYTYYMYVRTVCIHDLVCPLSHPLTRPLTRPLTHPLSHPLTHPLSHTLSHPLTHTHTHLSHPSLVVEHFILDQRSGQLVVTSDHFLSLGRLHQSWEFLKQLNE